MTHLIPIVILSFLFLPSYIYGTTQSIMCAQVIQYAENPSKTECQAFPTPCDVPKGWTPVKECSISNDSKKLYEVKFKLQKFATCDDLESRLIEITKKYRYLYWTPYPPVAMDMVALGGQSRSPMVMEKLSTPSNPPISTTNIQVLGVDEADTVKTDGKYIYNYSEESRNVRIVRMSDMTLAHSLKLPENFSSIQMYVSEGRLILIGQRFLSFREGASSRWYSPESKTLVMVYRITDPTKPVLERYHQIDGSYRDSRIIGGVLYFLSSNILRMPPIYLSKYNQDAKGFDKAISDIDKNFTINTLVPDIRESILGRNGRYLSSFRSSVSSCKDITFLLPDSATMANIDFSPALVSVSSINIKDPTAKMKSELLFGDVSQIHMSRNSLYITSVISHNNLGEGVCPLNARCAQPMIYQNINQTLIHKYSLSNGGLSYQYSTQISGNPMNQYSMDEDDNGNFRIVTQNYTWSSRGNENSTELSIIAPNGKILGRITDIAKGENFQSARFIGNRLYLVTFEQIDPFFVIDIQDPKSPKILGELKIPGYSTYLHPYDKDRLIGLGYDTTTNQWGGVQNAGIKIDLYNVSDVKNPKQEASLVLGDAGSSSDALWNPRVFVWYKEKNLLLLPATIMKNAKDNNDPYRVVSAFQGILGISILPRMIEEKFRVSHITLSADLEKEWKKECERYKGIQNTCRKLLDGTEYCAGNSTYIPSYCYAGSTVESYFASQIWNYSRDFITRALYVGDTFYSISESGMKSWNFGNTNSPKASISFSGSISRPVYPMPAVMR